MRSGPSLNVSVCIPIRNEAANLEECLQSLGGAFADVVVVDSASADGSVAIAERYGARVVQFVWNGRFPKKRNWAIQNVPFAHDWLLFLDADERVTTAFCDELEAVLPKTTHVGFWLSFTNEFMGCKLRYGDRFRKLALFRRSAGHYEAFPEEFWSTLDMEIHEHPVLRGSTGEIKSRLEHRDDRGLHHYIAKHNDYSTWESKRFLWFRTVGDDQWRQLSQRQRFKYRHLDKWWLAELYFWSSFVAKGGFLDGLAGWRFAAMKRRYFQDIRLKIQEERDRQRHSQSRA